MTQPLTVRGDAAAQTPSALAAHGIEKRFPTRAWRPRLRQVYVTALQGLDIDVAPGALHGVVGPNGSGKSTLLRILATLVIADAGTATVAGHDVRVDELAIRR